MHDKGREVLKELKEAGVNKISVSLNAHDKKTYMQICKPSFTSAFESILEFIEKAKEKLAFQNKKTILFIDEIHRFNKAQQDALLPDVEGGIVILIGATTENPYFSVIPSLISRSQVFEFESLTKEECYKIIDNCLAKIPEKIICCVVKHD